MAPRDLEKNILICAILMEDCGIFCLFCKNCDMVTFKQRHNKYKKYILCVS